VKFRKTHTHTAAMLALSGAMGLGSFPVFGQTTPAAPATTASESVVVTGSRVRRIDAETAAPVQIVTREQIQSSGVATVGDLLQDLPSISGAATNPQVNNGGGDGASTISLRGLGSERTLVLLDGRRLGASFDVNSIPLNLVERVDILKQGAGATYGSDAIGGVVNIVTRRNVQGVTIAYQTGKSSRGDAKTDNVELTFGSSTNRGHVAVGLNYNKQGKVSAGDRDFSKSALYWYTYDGAVNILKLGSSSTPQGRITIPNGTPGGSAATPSTPVLLPNGQTAAATFGCGGAAASPGLTPSATIVTRITGAAGSSLSDFRCYSGATDSYDYQPLNLALTPQERAGVFLDAAYNINDSIEIFASALHSNTKSSFQIAPLPMVANNDGWATSANNPFGLAFGSTAAGGTPGSNMQVRPVDLGTRLSVTETTLTQMTTGLRGSIPSTSWTWDAAYTYQGTKQNSSVDGYINGGLLQGALSGNAFNIFNVTGDNATGQASLVGLRPFSVGYSNFFTTNDRTVDIAFTGDAFALPAGTAQAAVGASWRRSWLNSRIDQLTLYTPPTFSSCLLAAETCSGPTTGSDEVSEVYGELFIPLLKNAPGAKALNLTLGTRFSQYDSFGDTTNSSVKLEYRPVTDLLFRGTWSQVFRAPTINDRFAAQQGGFPTFIDPCRSATGTEPGYAQACQFIAPGSGFTQDNSQILGLFGGNPDLSPEKGKVFTLGFVYDSSLLRGFSVTADYWHYRLNDAITAGDPTVIAQTCLAAPSAAFCGRIKRDPGTGQIDNVNLSNLNAGFIETEGFDVAVKYLTPATPFGRFQFGVDIAQTKSFKYDLGDGVVNEAAGTLDPSYGNFAKLRLGTQVQWSLGDLSLQWASRHIAKSDISNSKDANYGDTSGGIILVHQGGVTYHDVAVSYNLKAFGTTRLIAGVNNVGDKQPPLAYQFQVNGNVDVQTYDTIGRRWFVRVEQSF
jgi:iron complex outermembrane receptor protein